MPCATFQRSIAEYAFGETADMPAAEKAELEAHLPGCAECRKELAEVKAFYDLIRPPQNIRLPQEMLDATIQKVMARIRRNRQRRQRNRE